MERINMLPVSGYVANLVAPVCPQTGGGRTIEHKNCLSIMENSGGDFILAGKAIVGRYVSICVASHVLSLLMLHCDRLSAQISYRRV